MTGPSADELALERGTDMPVQRPTALPTWGPAHLSLVLALAAVGWVLAYLALGALLGWWRS